jgi:hypothetical protein
MACNSSDVYAVHDISVVGLAQSSSLISIIGWSLRQIASQEK